MTLDDLLSKLNIPMSEKMKVLVILDVVRNDENEECEKIADENTVTPNTEWGDGAKFNAKKIAKAIRARRVKK